jgi:carbohydrate kinase (thermoresistant glucokinase family)
MILILFGVSGAGKTEVGKRVAKRMNWGFLDADDHHPVENVEKMRAGTPLHDADRGPWLARLNAELRAIASRGENAVLACSALKRVYRDALTEGVPGARLVYLRVERSELARRLRERRGHFMKENMLESQLETFEEPSPEENAWVIESAGGVEETAEEIVAKAEGVSARGRAPGL